MRSPYFKPTMATKSFHPSNSVVNSRSSTPTRMPLLFILCSALAILTFLWTNAHLGTSTEDHNAYPNVPVNSEQILLQCASLRAVPGPPKDFRETRNESDRFELGTNSTLIRNATIWTGEKNGTLVIKGDLLLQRGLVTAIGDVPTDLFKLDQNLTIVEANGSWVTPGLGNILLAISNEREERSDSLQISYS